MSPFAPGTTVGPYRLEHQLGQGGMGTVYRATDTKLNRGVAIKFVSADLADASARRRFQREARSPPRSIIPTSSRSTTPASRTGASTW